MPDKHYIKIKQPQNDNLGRSLDALIDALAEYNKANTGDRLVIDLQELKFAFPLLVLPLSALITRLKTLGIDIELVPSKNWNDYLNLLNFPGGFNPKLDCNWQKTINKYRNKNYLPIVSIPASLSNLGDRENILDVFRQILIKQLNIDGQLKTVITYMVSEAFDNVIEHADVENGWIMVQNYPTKEFLDVCIVDTGKGILGSYASEKYKDITTDEQAINYAVNGKSTKDRPESRGYGISTSRRMLVKGLHGAYFLFSGRAFYYWSNTHEAINVIDDSLKWKGTILALRIPKNIPKGFNYIHFME